jgi:hypothetical protein
MKLGRNKLDALGIKAELPNVLGPKEGYACVTILLDHGADVANGDVIADVIEEG